MKLYWSPRTRAFRAAWMLEELGRPYDLVAIDIDDETSRADAKFRSASPMGKVPALIDGDVRLWDSGAICVYLADAYPDAGLGVTIGDPARGAFLQWTMYTNSVIEPALGEKFYERSANTRQSGFGSYDLMVDTLVDGLAGGPWILGERFTAPDVLLGSSIGFMDQFGALPERAALRDYLQRCRDRPAYGRASALETG